MAETEVDQAAQVDGGDAVGETELVAFDAAVAHPTVTVGDEPRDRAFDHGPVLPVVVDEITLAPRPPRFHEFGVVGTHLQGAPGLVAGASLAVRTAPADRAESDGPGRGDGPGVARGAGGRAGPVVDREVVAVEPAGDCPAQWDCFDGGVVAAPTELDADLAGAVGGVGKDLQTPFLAVQERHAGGAVAGVGRGKHARSDEPGLGLDRDVSLVAVAVVAAGLVHVAGLGIHGRDHPIRRDLMRDPPCAVLVAGLDILTRDQREEPDRVGLVRCEHDVGHRVEDRVGVRDEAGDQRVLRVRVVPRTYRLPTRVIVMGAHHHGAGLGHQAPHAADRRDQLGDRVLGRHGVVEQRRRSVRGARTDATACANT